MWCCYCNPKMEEDRLGESPLVQDQQFSRFLALGLGLHYIPVLVVHTPPCSWLLRGKQISHGGGESSHTINLGTHKKHCVKNLSLRKS